MVPRATSNAAAAPRTTAARTGHNEPQQRRAVRLGGSALSRPVVMGSRRQGHVQPGRLHRRVHAEPLREGRHRLARRAERHLRGVGRSPPRLQPARLPEGHGLRRPDVRRHAHQVPDAPRRPARLRQVGAHLLGGSAHRDRRQGHGRHRQRRPRGSRLRHGHDEHRFRPRHAGAVPPHIARRHDVARRMGERRRPADGRHPDLGSLQRRRHLGRLLQLRLHHDLARQPGLHAHPRRALHARSRATAARRSSSSRRTTTRRRCTPTSG